jgi:pimeloyl-ACP methyl ester carboxylesterase
MNPQNGFLKIVRSVVTLILSIVGILVGLLILALLFFSWQTSRREIKTITEAAPSTGFFVTADNTKIFIQEAGSISGEPVVLIHGTGAWSEIWRDTITVLTKAGFHVYALDLPPFGYSEKLDDVSQYSRQNQAKRIKEVIDALHLKKAILVGHSVGARPTIEVALEYPEKVEKLVLVDPALGFQTNPSDIPHFEQNHPSFFMQMFFLAKPLRNAVISTYGTNPLFTKNLFASFVSQKNAITSTRLHMLKQPLVVANTTHAYGDWLESLVASLDSSEASDFSNFKKISAPVYIIWGSSDAVTPVWQGRELQTLIPGSHLSIIENVGHIPFVEDPENFNKILLNFLIK